MERIATIVEAAPDQMIGLNLTGLAVDGCITDAPGHVGLASVPDIDFPRDIKATPSVPSSEAPKW